MLPIPSSLLDKVKQAMQTIGNNAEPKMTILAQKAAKFLSQGSFLNPRTVRTGNSLGPLDICIRRETRHQEPTEIVMAYIEDGLAKVATLPYVHTPDQYFEYQYTVGPATDVACDFDGRWNLITDRSDLYFDTTTIWELITFGEPYIATVSAGALDVRQGQNASFNLASNVVKCSIIRGWKARFEFVTNDQGIICAYTKNDTKAYYRNYCEQGDGSFIWEIEQEITEFGASIESIALFRSADYRIGFLINNSIDVKILMTKRNWSGMATLPEYIQVSNVVVTKAQLINITYSDYKSGDEYLKINDIAADAWVMSTYSPILLSSQNISIELIDKETGLPYDDWGYLVRFEFDQIIRNAEYFPADFILEDSLGFKLYGQEAYKEPAKSRFVYVLFPNFNNAHNPITARAVAGNLSNGYIDLVETDVQFTAENLVAFETDPPEVVSIENIESWEAPV